MKKYICILSGVALLAACERKEATVNPPAGKKRKQYDDREGIAGPFY